MKEISIIPGEVKGGGVIKHWRGFCGAENILYLDFGIMNK